MAGAVLLRLEPRLDGVVVVNAPDSHSRYLGRRFPWTRVRLSEWLVHVVENDGEPLRSDDTPPRWIACRWIRESMTATGQRAWLRAITRQFDDGSLTMTFNAKDDRLGSAISGSVFLLFAILITFDFIRAFWGAPVMFPPMPPGYGAIDVVLLSIMWLILGGSFLLMAGLMLSLYRCSLGKLRFRSSAIEWLQTDGSLRSFSKHEIVSFPRSWSHGIKTDRGTQARFIPMASLRKVIDLYETRWRPREIERRKAARRASYARAGVIWVLGCIGAGFGLWYFGPPPSPTGNGAVNSAIYAGIVMVVYAALFWLAARLQSPEFRDRMRKRAERRKRRKARRDRQLARASGRSGPLRRV
ncbi:MAG: hypothetical protein U0638_08205 [Phycisphaerales bacterium]